MAGSSPSVAWISNITVPTGRLSATVTLWYWGERDHWNVTHRAPSAEKKLERYNKLATHKDRCIWTHSTCVREGCSGCTAQQRHNQVREMYKSISEVPCSSTGELSCRPGEPRPAIWALEHMQSCYIPLFSIHLSKVMGSLSVGKLLA